MKRELNNMYVIVGVDNEMYFATISHKNSTSKSNFLFFQKGSMSWKHYYKSGYRCKKVKITFEEIK